MGVRPAGIAADAISPLSSTTRSSERPLDSAFSIPRADTAERISSTTMESASDPSAAATAASQPGVIEISEARRPLTRASLRPERTASPPSR